MYSKNDGEDLIDNPVFKMNSISPLEFIKYKSPASFPKVINCPWLSFKLMIDGADRILDPVLTMNWSLIVPLLFI